MKRRGTVLMECLLALPLLVTLIFSIVQFSLIWYAQLMTHYAAYNAARAALVYHPAEYRVTEGGQVQERFRTDSGVCWSAAVRTLASVSFSPEADADAASVTVPGWTWPTDLAIWFGNPTHPARLDGVDDWVALNVGRTEAVPNSSLITRQVRILSEWKGDLAPSVESSGYVKVCVEFDFPLAVPVIGKMIAHFQHALEVESEHVRDFGADGDWEVWGWHPSAEARERAKTVAAAHDLKMDYMTLHAFCILSKPWTSERWARLSDDDLKGMVE